MTFLQLHYFVSLSAETGHLIEVIASKTCKLVSFPVNGNPIMNYSLQVDSFQCFVSLYTRSES